MKYRIPIALILFLSLASTRATAQKIFPGLGEQRVGISSFTFLKIGVGPRATAMGESFIAVADDASSLFWNPAGAVQAGRNEVMFSHTEWFADVRHEFLGVLYQLTSADAVGLSAIALYTDDMPRTTVFQPTGTGEMFSFRDLAVGLTYSRRMTDQFSFGVTARYVRESFAELTMQSVVFDLGAYYWTGFQSTRFSIVLSNFGGTVRPTGSVDGFGVGAVDRFEEFSPPTLFKIAFAMDPVDLESHKLTTSLQLNHPNDNAENVGIGLEYS
ncbi:MAG: PorV/PorQ family protein, partial [Bacteroidota bacterium]